jgi:aspartate-semialdehyde dehydrogenase
MWAHAESINLEFAKDISEKDALEALQKFPGVSIIDDRWDHLADRAAAAAAAAA